MVFYLGLPLRIAQGGMDFLCRILTDIGQQAWQRHCRRNAYRRSLQDLRDLDGRLLTDVGLNAADQARGRPERKF